MLETLPDKISITNVASFSNQEHRLDIVRSRRSEVLDYYYYYAIHRDGIVQHPMVHGEGVIRYLVSMLDDEKLKVVPMFVISGDENERRAG